MASHNQVISIGRVYEQAFCSDIKTDPPHTYENWNPDGAFEEAVERGAEAVLLYALDLMAAAGVEPVEAAAQLRAGRTIEEVSIAGRVRKYGSTVDVETEIESLGRHPRVGDPAADPCDDGPGSGKSETEGDECPDGFSSPGAGFCAGLGCCGVKGA